MSLLTPGQNGRNSLFLFCFFFFLSSLFFSVFSHGQAPRQFHKEGSSGGPKAAKHRGKFSEAVVPREWGKPHCSFFLSVLPSPGPRCEHNYGKCTEDWSSKGQFSGQRTKREVSKNQKVPGIQQRKRSLAKWPGPKTCCL